MDQLTESWALDFAKLTQALITKTHVVLPSGFHTNVILDKDVVRADHRIMPLFALHLCQMFNRDSYGAIVSSNGDAHLLSALVARQRMHDLHPGCEGCPRIPHVCATVDGGGNLRLDHSLIIGENVLVVEDIITSGGTLRGLIKAVHEAGKTVIGAGAIWNRGSEQFNDLGVPVRALINVRLDTWPKESCPMCEAGIQIVRDLRQTP